jgi:hypothetical protein
MQLAPAVNGVCPNGNLVSFDSAAPALFAAQRAFFGAAGAAAAQ